MKQKKSLNESVKVIKEGNSQIFSSIKEASIVTGLSVNAIKTRCGKRSIPKDNIVCEWADEHTKRSKQAKRNRGKGNSYELKIINDLKNIGYVGCVSSRSLNKIADANKIDIIDVNEELPINIQAKNTINTPNYFAIREACPDKTKPFVIIWKKSNYEKRDNEIAMIPLKYLYKILKK